MRFPSTSVSLPPDTICGYTIVRSPSPGTFIALADGGRKVLLKPLDTDCLLHGQLHPSIKERLSRVRELALKSAANLHGVERDKQGVFLVWEFIDGQPLESHAQSVSRSQFISMMREVVLSVLALHQVGIVHGALHSRNVIVDTAGRPRLTHISPLLFHDPAVDDTAIAAMLANLMERRTDMDAAMGSLLQKPASLRQLASSLVTADAPQAQSHSLDLEDRRRRRRMLLVAMAVAVLGALVAAIVTVVARRP
jgi:serine/threonine protein kinase